MQPKTTEAEAPSNEKTPGLQTTAVTTENAIIGGTALGNIGEGQW